MISQIFYQIINMSITASLTGIIVLMLRNIPKIPRSVISFLWLIPVIRMISPFGIKSRLSFFTPVFTDILYWHYNSRPVGMVLISSQDYLASGIPGLISSHMTFYSEDAQGCFKLLAYIWLTVSSVLLILLTASYISAVTAFRNAEKTDNGVYISDRTDSPVLAGILFPKIILPCGCSEKNSEFIILHEKMHIRRRDNLKRMILLILSCIYWFNPLILIMIRKCLSDIEFSCDEAVLKHCGESVRKEYASTVINAAEAKNIILSSLGGFRTKKRIHFILSYKKATGLSTLFFFILVFFFAYILLTNAAALQNHFTF